MGVFRLFRNNSLIDIGTFWQIKPHVPLFVEFMYLWNIFNIKINWKRKKVCRLLILFLTRNIPIEFHPIINQIFCLNRYYFTFFFVYFWNYVYSQLEFQLQHNTPYTLVEPSSKHNSYCHNATKYATARPLQLQVFLLLLIACYLFLFL